MRFVAFAVLIASLALVTPAANSQTTDAASRCEAIEDKQSRAACFTQMSELVIDCGRPKDANEATLCRGALASPPPLPSTRWWCDASGVYYPAVGTCAKRWRAVEAAPANTRRSASRPMPPTLMTPTAVSQLFMVAIEASVSGGTHPTVAGNPAAGSRVAWIPKPPQRKCRGTACGCAHSAVCRVRRCNHRDPCQQDRHRRGSIVAPYSLTDTRATGQSNWRSCNLLQDRRDVSNTNKNKFSYLTGENQFI
jgi:hypothetical protein